MKTISKLTSLLLILAIFSCTDRQEKKQGAGTKYMLDYYEGKHASITVYDNNDTIYLNANDSDNLVKIVSDTEATDSIRNSVRRHLNYKSLNLINSTVSCGGGGWLTVKMDRGNTHLEITQGNLASSAASRNISGLLFYLERKHKEIDKAF